LPDDVPVFIIDMGRADVLLAASDFYGAVAGSAFVPEHDPADGQTYLSAKGARHECLFLEPVFLGLFGDSLSAAEPDSAAFLMKKPGMPPWAFVLGRGFEMRSFPLAEFRLLPRGLRPFQARSGLSALRFEGPGRIQYLLRLDVIKTIRNGGAIA